jgi:hypothetical protein
VTHASLLTSDKLVAGTAPNSSRRPRPSSSQDSLGESHVFTVNGPSSIRNTLESVGATADMSPKNASPQRAGDAYFEINAAGSAPTSRGREITLHDGTFMQPSTPVSRGQEITLHAGPAVRVGTVQGSSEAHPKEDDRERQASDDGASGYRVSAPVDSISFPTAQASDEDVIPFRTSPAGGLRSDGDGVLAAGTRRDSSNTDVDVVALQVPSESRNKFVPSERSPHSESWKGGPYVIDLLGGGLDVDDPFRLGVEGDGSASPVVATTGNTGRSQTWSVRNESPERKFGGDAGGGSSREDVFEASVGPAPRARGKGLPYMSVHRVGTRRMGQE